jgi:hypothetical protein
MHRLGLLSECGARGGFGATHHAHGKRRLFAALHQWLIQEKELIRVQQHQAEGFQGFLPCLAVCRSFVLTIGFDLPPRSEVVVPSILSCPAGDSERLEGPFNLTGRRPACLASRSANPRLLVGKLSILETGACGRG